MLSATRATLPVLREHAAQSERDRRVADASLTAARNAGAFRLATPENHGGLGAGVALRCQVLSELGRACPSTAWVAATTAEVKVPLSFMASQQTQALAFSDPDAVLCASARSGRAVAVADGMRISGRWTYASGCDHASGALLALEVVDGIDGARPAAVFVSTADLSIERTWETAGLSGTGSHTLVADDLFVPNAQVLDTSRTPGGTANLAIALGLAAPLVGAARGALDVMTPVMGERRPPGTRESRLADVAGARQWLAEATHLVCSAERSVTATAEIVDAALLAEPLTVQARAELRMELLAAIRRCRRALDDLLDLHGSSAFFTSNPLQRYWRDFAIGSRHVSLTSYLAAEDYGRVLSEVGEPVSGIL